MSGREGKTLPISSLLHLHDCCDCDPSQQPTTGVTWISALSRALGHPEEHAGEFPLEHPGELPDEHPGEFPEEHPEELPEELPEEHPEEHPGELSDEHPGELPWLPEELPAQPLVDPSPVVCACAEFSFIDWMGVTDLIRTGVGEFARCSIGFAGVTVGVALDEEGCFVEAPSLGVALEEGCFVVRTPVTNSTSAFGVCSEVG